MADEQKHIAYKNDPARYNKQCVNQWQSWFDRFRDRIIENYQLLDNYSEDLAQRKADNKSGKFVRACLFIPTINPAVLGRSADMMVKVWGVNNPISAISENKLGGDKNSENVKDTIHWCLKKNKFTKTFFLMKMAQETLPISFLRVSEHEDEQINLKIEPRQYGKTPQERQAGVELTKEKKWIKTKGQWYPKITFLAPQYVFYDPEPNEWDKKSFVGTVTPLTLAELVSRKNTHYYKFSEADLKDRGEKWKDEFTNELASQAKQENKATTGTSSRYKVIENYHLVEDEKGNTQAKKTVSCGDLTLFDGDFAYDKLKITDIFIPCVGYPMLNRVEGTTTVDLMKHLQHGINDFFNIVIDTAKYGLFPPNLRDSRAKIISERKVTPGGEQVVDLTNMPLGATLNDVIKQQFQVSPTGKDFFALGDFLFERSEIVGAAPLDILIGGEGKPQEKATKTVMRKEGASKRLAGISLMQDVEILKQLAYVIWTMILERLQYGEEYKIGNKSFELEDLMGEFEFDVPHLSGTAERELRIMQLDKLLLILQTMPFFRQPALLPVLYKVIQEKAKAELIVDFDKIFPESVLVEIQEEIRAQMGGGEGEMSPADVLAKIIPQGGAK